MAAKVEPQAGEVKGSGKQRSCPSPPPRVALSARVSRGREGTRACAGRERWAAMSRPKNRAPSCQPTRRWMGPSNRGCTGGRVERASGSGHVLAHLGIVTVAMVGALALVLIRAKALVSLGFAPNGHAKPYRGPPDLPRRPCSAQSTTLCRRALDVSLVSERYNRENLVWTNDHSPSHCFAMGPALSPLRAERTREDATENQPIDRATASMIAAASSL